MVILENCHTIDSHSGRKCPQMAGVGLVAFYSHVCLDFEMQGRMTSWLEPETGLERVSIKYGSSSYHTTLGELLNPYGPLQ
jgi:hypothetical protein